MGKGSSKGHTPREAKDNLKSTQLLSVIDAISEGPIEGPVDGLKSVLLNSTPVLDSEGNANISGVTVVFRAGEQEQTPPEGFESSGSETVLGTEVKYDTPITRTTQLLSVIDAISEGPVEGPVDGLKSVLLNSTPVLDSEGNTNIAGVTVVFRAGEQEQTPPEGFESSGSETVLGTEVKYDTPITRTITSANIDRLRFTFGVQALVETTSKGDRNPSEVRLLVQIQRNGGWVTEKDITIKGKTTSQYLASVVVDN
ncbi:TipJ family phage tail tip protein, partial [Escherichia coli]|uniref:TipJ family phage tail tip protein n=1 Tax=Escherichia coli TaxID=562 RepID=UPI003D77B31C